MNLLLLSYEIYSFNSTFWLLQNKIKYSTDWFGMLLVQSTQLFKNPHYKIQVTMQNITQVTTNDREATMLKNAKRQE